MQADAPRANRDPAELERKRARLGEAHIAPLTDFVERLRTQRGGGEAVPWVDPTEAGVRARILILLEAPGARAAGRDAGPARSGSGFVSPDNDDPSAQNMWGILREAGVNRAVEVVTWNIVPWYVGDGTRIRAVTDADREEARPALLGFLDLLPNLRVVVLLGRAAAKGWLAAAPRHLPVIEAPHPSPKVLNTRPAARAEIVAALREARSVAGLPPGAPAGAAPAAPARPPPAATPVKPRGPAPQRAGGHAGGVDAHVAEAVVRAYHEGERLELQAIGGRFGMTTQEVERVLWEWEPRVYPRLHLEPRPEEIVAARDGLLPPSRLLDRDNPKLRWERIAHRAGVPVAEVRRRYEQVKGDGAAGRSYTGKGRRFEGME